ncbi:D-alanine--D-alanine ligase [uncultured Sphaerochaeta sp.]|uniref:D-alanine--D-alanine ligase n=1 Tax=uncultured Sphaerochaeta sp. TaxID=886478 RepID=UPI002A0A8C1E|nr:D-alanine--D-alanine ligase [uncultured Sphaerochaeta sp.]
MHIALIYGGRSAEHIVSIKSAQNIYEVLKHLGHDVFPIAITLNGRFFLQKDKPIEDTIREENEVMVRPGLGFWCNDRRLSFDVAFPVTHGKGGEDGNLQGLCALAQVPLCGCDTVSSGLGMHKELAQRIYASAGLPVIPSLTLDKTDIAWLREEEGVNRPIFLQQLAAFCTCMSRIEVALPVIQEKLGAALLVKPEDSGSSVGVTALKKPNGGLLIEAINLASHYSERVLIQTLIEPLQEIECAVLSTQNEGIVVGGPGLVLDPAKDASGFLTYGHKYGQIDTAHIQIPSDLPKDLENQIKNYAKQVFFLLRCEGYARVDFFHSRGLIYINEINTLPGMTASSHFPVLMKEKGYDLEKTVQILIEDALERAKEDKERTYVPPGI